jgi:cytoskeleton protein RodZ
MGTGRRLREAREGRGLSLGEVAARTKIPARQLAALESEDYGKLPGGIFVRGHVRAAAQAVGLDPAELAARFEEETSPRPPVIVAPQAEAAEGNRGPRSWRAADWRDDPVSPSLVAAIAIVISIALAIAWLGRGRDEAPASRESTTPPPIALPAPRTAGTAALGTTGTRDGEIPGPAEGVALSLEAQRVCWLALTVDGQRVAYRMLRPGEVVTARMRTSATLRAGDAGALLVSVGGGAAKPLGPAGAVRSLDMTPANYERVLTR